MSARAADLLMFGRLMMIARLGPYAFLFHPGRGRCYGYWPRRMMPFL